MLFNSIDFAVFLPIVFVLYWFVINTNIKWQNLLVAAASYFFYGWWDWRFLALILFSTIVDYMVGMQLSKEENVKKRKILLWVSMFVNLGFLGFFKYYNFFLDNFASAFTFLGMPINVRSLSIVLPVGISFYTFQTMSYTIDVYRRKLKATNDFVAFMAFVSFFPQLVAGPIERATHLLPQFYVKRKFSYDLAVNGLRQILWGLFKKVVIADGCAEFANMIFNHSETYSGSTLVLGAIFFTFQIYGDFSGYSDIAIGTARLFGFDLMQNFAFPYFSRDIAEFWRRWHISLSTWFRDYLYIPLGGSRGDLSQKVRNTFIIFIVSGFWHGPKWTFIVWGTLNAIYFLPLLLLNRNRINTNVVAEGKFLPTIREISQMSITFLLTVFAWVFFRANDLNHAFTYLGTIFSESLFSVPMFSNRLTAVTMIGFIVIFMLIEWLGRHEKFAIEKLGLSWKRPIRYFAYYLLVATILYQSLGAEETQFIYFQF